MEYHTLVEPEFYGSYWCNQYMQGIKYNAAKNNGCVNEISLQDAGRIASDPNAGRPVVLIVGTSLDWMASTVRTLGEMGIHSIILAPSNAVYFPNASSITMDYAKMMYTLCEYFLSLGRGKIALLGVHPNSLNDISKKNAFLYFQQYRQHIQSAEQDIFWNYGKVEESCVSFYNKVDSYNGVICSSDIVALKLSSYLKQRGVPVPEKLFIAGFGNTLLCQVVRPRITTVTLDCYSIGKNAVHMYTFLARNPSLSSLSATVMGNISVRDTTASMLPAHKDSDICPPVSVPQEDFYLDPDVQTIFQLENLISNCNDMDFAILTGLSCGLKYAVLSEKLNATENTVKYRIKRMLSLCGQKNPKSLLRLVQSYLQVDGLPDIRPEPNCH